MPVFDANGDSDKKKPDQQETLKVFSVHEKAPVKFLKAILTSVVIVTPLIVIASAIPRNELALWALVILAALLFASAV